MGRFFGLIFCALATLLPISAEAQGDPALTPYVRRAFGLMSGPLRFAGFATGSEPVTCAAGEAGDVIYNTTSNVLFFCNGTTWGAVGGGASTVTGTGTATRLAFWDGTSSITSDADLTWTGGNTLSVTGTISLTGALSASGGAVTFGSLTASRALFLDGSSIVSTTGASAALLAALSDETGSGVAVFGTSPTFTTSIEAPLVIGGTGTTSTLLLRSTSHVSGTTGADIVFQVGANGATEGGRFLNSGTFRVGSGTLPGTAGLGIYLGGAQASSAAVTLGLANSTSTGRSSLTFYEGTTLKGALQYLNSADGSGVVNAISLYNSNTSTSPQFIWYNDSGEIARLTRASSITTLLLGNGISSALQFGSNSNYLANSGSGVVVVTAGFMGMLFDGLTISIGGNATATTVKFLEPSGSGTNFTALIAQAQSGDITYTLPAANGAGGLVNDGSGGLSWGGVTTGITASTTQTQGQGALTSELNIIATCANPNDTVTLPGAVAGKIARLANNGAQTLQIFPASGDNLGAGVDASTTLVAGANRTFIAYDGTNWEVF